MSDEMITAPADVPAAPPAPPTVGGQPRRWVVPLATGVAGVVLGAGGVGAAWVLSGPDTPKAPKTFALSGTMTLKSPTPLDFNHQACAGSGGYGDIVSGAAVTVYDDAGKVVATGSLGSGKYESADSAAPCVFPVSVAGVPQGPRFFQIEISHRGKLTLAADDAQAGRFAGSLG